MSSPPPPPPGWTPPDGPSWPPPPGQPGGTPPPPGQPGGTPPPPGQPAGMPPFAAPGSTPPPFAMPGGTTPPPFGLPGPQPPPARRSGNGALLAILLGGGLVVVLILAAAFIVLLDTDKSPTERLNAAARSLSTARALTWRGTFGTQRIAGEVKVTSSGRATGPVTWSGDRVTLLVTDGHLFVQADKSYWSGRLRTTNVDELPDSGQHWGKLTPTELSFDFKQYATPSALAARMRSVRESSVRSDTKTTVQGRKAVKIVTFTGTYYLSEDGDELLRVESFTPYINADVTAQRGSAADGTISELRTRVGELRDAWDSTQSPRAPKIEGCKNGSESGCTVRVQVSTFGSSGSTQVNVYVWITETTKTGRRLGDCSTLKSVPGTTSVWAECRVSGSSWADFYRRTKLQKPAWLHAQVVAIALTSDEVRELQAAIDRE